MTTPTLVQRHFLNRGQGLEFDMEVAWVRRHLCDSDGLILDVGCGIGALFEAIGPARVIGLDHSADGLDHTLRRYPKSRLCCGTVNLLPFCDCSLSAITCQHVVEHLPDPAMACREWYRVVRPGGMLLVLTPSARFVDPSVYDDETHVRVFDTEAISSLVEDAGFEVLDIRTLGLPWFRNYQNLPAGWRFRRWVVEQANVLSCVPTLKWSGQTLCCAARRPAE